MISALIPIKAHSERVEQKNFRELNNTPLYKHIIKTLSKSEFIHNIYIDTDARYKLDLKEFNNVHIIDRPDYLIGDFVSVNALIEYDLQFIDSDIILQTHVTNPFLKKETIDRCIQSFIDKDVQSLFSVTELYERFWTKKGKPINHNPNELIRTQDLEPLYLDNSCIYMFTRDFFNNNKLRINEKSTMFKISKEESLDIDTEYDWNVAVCFAKQ